MDANIKIKVPDKFFGYKRDTTVLESPVKYNRIVEKTIMEWANKNNIKIEPLHEELSFRFVNLNHALLFKLRMGEWIDSIRDEYSPVILPIIRRLMPTLIAQDIIGAQPMTGPSAQIFSLRARYGNDEDTETN